MYSGSPICKRMHIVIPSYQFGNGVVEVFASGGSGGFCGETRGSGAFAVFAAPLVPFVVAFGGLVGFGRFRDALKMTYEYGNMSYCKRIY
jgi:hypothetical protein